MGDLAVLDMAAGADHLEPSYVVDRRGGARDRLFDRVLDSGRRAADDLDHLVDIVVHHLAPRAPEAVTGKSERGCRPALRAAGLAVEVGACFAGSERCA